MKVAAHSFWRPLPHHTISVKTYFRLKEKKFFIHFSFFPPSCQWLVHNESSSQPSSDGHLATPRVSTLRPTSRVPPHILVRCEPPVPAYARGLKSQKRINAIKSLQKKTKVETFFPLQSFTWWPFLILLDIPPRALSYLETPVPIQTEQQSAEGEIRKGTVTTPPSPFHTSIFSPSKLHPSSTSP